MHIKTLTVSGFRSYKDQMEVEPFSPRHNVVVGRNGSGKSNFFDAIRFVLLNVRFANLRQEERQLLLHEGTGSSAMSAFVEVVFDNSAGRFPVDSDEVVLRRTIGLRKDEMFLNRRHVSKSDVINMLESAGFSRSNPYYIVQQGKVNTLCLMHDHERLELLKEVAGTRVYEERKQESLQLMQESISKREKIEEVIEYIQARLSELQDEKQELLRYQQWDRKKRALSYSLYDKELTQAVAELEALEASRGQASAQSAALHERAQATHEAIRECEKQLKARLADLKRQSGDKAALEAERTELMQEEARLEVVVRDLTEKVSADSESKESLQATLVDVEAQIADAQSRLDAEALPAFEAARDALAATSAQLADAQRVVDGLYAKQGRGAQFDSVEARDAFLERELQQLQQTLDEKDASMAKLRESVASLETRVAEAEAESGKTAEEQARVAAEIERHSSSLSELSNEKHQVLEQRKDQWRAGAEVDEQVARLREELAAGERSLSSSMPRALSKGLEAVRRVAAERGLGERVFGPLVELFQVEARFRTAVEVAAGNALFHVVVDTDETAAAIMRELHANSLGRVTFLPLNRLRAPEPTDPGTRDAFPLLNKLTFDARFRVAMLHVFGKKLLCKDLTVAAEVSAASDMDAVTMHGDEVSRKGGFRGGFHDPGKSRLAAMADLVAKRAELQAGEAEQEKTRAVCAEIDQRATHLLGEVQKLDARRSNLRTASKHLAKDAKSQHSKLQSLREALEQQAELLRELEASRAELAATAAGARAELGTELQESLSDAERAEQRSKSAEVAELKRAAAEQTKALTAARASKSELETLLHSNLLLRQEELQARLGAGEEDGAVSFEEHKQSLLEHSAEHQRASEAVAAAAARIEQLAAKIDEHQEEMRELRGRLEELKAEDEAAAEELQNEAKRVEKQLHTRSLLMARREENRRKIREVGALPAAELAESETLSKDRLQAGLKECNSRLKEFAHVNKKALDQFVSFNEQYDTLLARKEELDDGETSIRELVDVLDQQKDAAILLTLKGVSHHFSEVFQELVPEGRGQIIMRTAEDAEPAAEGEQLRVAQFEGVQIRVSFTGGGEQYLMQQLSGGQKALVALALIFAIQRCDPAPFYLFDEIDQALDSSYRTAVAALIHRQAEAEDGNTQFITSTFRPEMVAVADKFYGVAHRNKVSHIYTYSKDDALAFISDIMAEEQQDAGPAAAAGPARAGPSATPAAVTPATAPPGSADAEVPVASKRARVSIS